MKKIIKLSFILLIAICIMGNVYAALSCNVVMQVEKTEFSNDEEFTVNVNLTNVQTEQGIISLGVILEYDKDSLILVKMEGQNNWETPSEGVSYNVANGKIAITRNGLGKNDETVFRMTFKVKKESKQNLTIALKDIIVADGTKPMVTISGIEKSITIKNGIPNSVSTPETDNQAPNTNTNQTSNDNANQVPNLNTNKDLNTTTSSGEKIETNTQTNKINRDTVKSGTLPKTGDTSIMLIILIGLLILATMIFFIKIKNINKEIKK